MLRFQQIAVKRMTPLTYLRRVVYVCAVSPRRRANFYLDSELLSGLKALKARVGIPESEAVRRAVAEYLERQRVPLDSKAERKRPASRKRP
jgi:hypothetical protein